MNEDQKDNVKSGYFTPFDVDRHLAEYSSTSFFQRVGSLPDSLKDIMANPSTAEFIEEKLGTEFSMNYVQKIEVTRIIRDVLLGDISINAMASKISENLEIDSTVAYQIQSKIVNELFGPAIEDIKKLQTERFPEKPDRPVAPMRPQTQKITEGSDLKIDPDINRNNVVDLRNK